MKSHYRPICPKLGHLVHPRAGGPLEAEFSRIGLIVSVRGIEVLVMTEIGDLVWVRRDSLEVIDAS